MSPLVSENAASCADRGPLTWHCLRRMDLLRAAVLGPEGTPYADQLFVFDVQLAPGHPAGPPRVAYHSWGLRVNPNLYEDGKVEGSPRSTLCALHAPGTAARSCTALHISHCV